MKALGDKRPDEKTNEREKTTCGSASHQALERNLQRKIPLLKRILKKA